MIRFTERVRINGTEIGEEEVVRLAGRVIAAAPVATTFFELVTALAYLHFAEQQVDLAIMEAGMGGRYDATNAASGILSVITPVSLDHSEYLGKTVAEIAFEKAGVIKPGQPVVTSARDEEALAVVRLRCTKLSSPLYCWGDHFSTAWKDGRLTYHGLHADLAGLKPGIAGRYQEANAACALATAELLGGLGFPLTAENLRVGIETAYWPGRMELTGEAPRILLDGAHNPAGGLALADALQDVPHEKLILVAGVMAVRGPGTDRRSRSRSASSRSARATISRWPRSAAPGGLPASMRERSRQVLPRRKKRQGRATSFSSAVRSSPSARPWPFFSRGVSNRSVADCFLPPFVKGAQKTTANLNQP